MSYSFGFGRGIGSRWRMVEPLAPSPCVGIGSIDLISKVVIVLGAVGGVIRSQQQGFSWEFNTHNTYYHLKNKIYQIFKSYLRGLGYIFCTF